MKRIHNFFLLSLSLLLSVGIIFSPLSAEALTEEQKKAMQSGSLYFDVEDAGVACAANNGGGLVGADNAEQIFNFFVSRGYKPFQAAGFMGNMMAESGLNPRALQPGTTGDAPIPNRGYGLVQWTTPGRQQGLKDQAVKMGKPVYDLSVQLEYVLVELESPYYKSRVTVPLLASTDVRQATTIIELHYEVHAGPPQERRQQWAQGFLAQYGSGAASASTVSTGGTVCGGGGQTVGNYSLPIDRSWPDKNPGLLNAPHHDYPAIDIPLPERTPIYAITGGTIRASGGDCGRGVSIDGDDGATYVYCHGIDGGSVAGATTGSKVRAGQLIMHSGNTGHSTGPHLHVAIIIGRTKYCPQNLLKGIYGGTVPDVRSLPTSGCVKGSLVRSRAV